MRVLLLVQKEQRVILDNLYAAIAANVSHCDTRWMTSAEQDDLRGYFRNKVRLENYDRIVFFLRFKKEIRQVRFIQTVPNLVILEHDAYQNYIPGKYRGKFSAHYKKLPWARIICSGYNVSCRLKDEGFDAVFVPKGYDANLFRNLHMKRDVELGFLGSLKGDAYDGRRALLEELAKEESMLVTRTNSGEEYLNMLNRIRFFVGADVGMGEYMIKNFEAMACGCVVFVSDQGEAENAAIGFKDMENVVTYRNVIELREKLRLLRNEAGLADCIAESGTRFVCEHLSWDINGKKIAEALRKPLSPHIPRKGLLKLLGY